MVMFSLPKHFPGQNVWSFPAGGPTASAPLEPEPKRPVLIVLHQETSTPGRVGNALRALGHDLDIRRPRFGDPLPETLDEHAGAVVFGGPMSANDGEDYIRAEIDWIKIPLRERRPFLGICLGAQMLAKHLGAPVAPHPQGRIQIGYYPVRPTGPDVASARIGPATSITGIARALSFLTEPSCLPRGMTFRCRRSAMTIATVCNFIPT
jgi:GMP synthase (glutamine-hydrolysing)